MSEKITDISGIGKKTAEKIRASGIGSKQELLEAFKNGRPEIVGNSFESGLNKRAKDGIRQEITQQGGSFTDPVFGIPVTEDNERAREAFDLDVGSDVASGFGEFTRDNPQYSGSNVLDLAGEALRGDLGPGLSPQEYDDISQEQQFGSNKGPRESDEAETAKRSAFEFALDAAANVSEYDRETIERGNELARRTSLGTFTVRQEETVERETQDGTIEASEKRQVPTRNYAKAQQAHQDRSAEARQVDNRRKAKIADSYEQWRQNPSQYDYPGVDTPAGRNDILQEDRREQADQIKEAVASGDEDVTRVAFGEAVGQTRRFG